MAIMIPAVETLGKINKYANFVLKHSLLFA